MSWKHYALECLAADQAVWRRPQTSSTTGGATGDTESGSKAKEPNASLKKRATSSSSSKLEDNDPVINAALLTNLIGIYGGQDTTEREEMFNEWAAQLNTVVDAFQLSK